MHCFLSIVRCGVWLGSHIRRHTNIISLTCTWWSKYAWSEFSSHSRCMSDAARMMMDILSVVHTRQTIWRIDLTKNRIQHRMAFLYRIYIWIDRYVRTHMMGYMGWEPKHWGRNGLWNEITRSTQMVADDVRRVEMRFEMEMGEKIGHKVIIVHNDLYGC